jgi:hypothetical protein
MSQTGGRVSMSNQIVLINQSAVPQRTMNSHWGDCAFGTLEFPGKSETDTIFKAIGKRRCISLKVLAAL